MKTGMRIWGVVALMGMLTGCAGRALLPYEREMEDMALIRTMGVDGTAHSVELTVATDADGASGEALVLSADGPSVSAACQAVQGMGDTFIYYGYVDQLLLGQERARLDVGGVLDYLGRDREPGLGVRLWVVRDATARQAMEGAGSRGVTGRLGQLRTDSELGAANLTRTAGELMAALAQGGSTYLPALRIEPARDGDGTRGAEQTLNAAGYAVLRQGKLVCFADGDEALGLELLEERPGGRISHVTLADGAGVSVAIESSQVSCHPDFSGEELTGLRVLCRLSCRVTGLDRRLSQQDVDRLEQRLEKLEGQRMAQTLGLAQYWDADFLNLMTRTGGASPRHWELIREQWEGCFRTLDMTVEIRADVERSGNIMR